MFKTFRFSVRLKNQLEFTSKVYEIKHVVLFLTMPNEFLRENVDSPKPKCKLKLFQENLVFRNRC